MPETSRPKHPCTCPCGCLSLVFRRGTPCTACRYGCRACGCWRNGARCGREGELYAALEAALNRLKALGCETHPECLGSAPPHLADALTQARREYDAHFGGQMRI